MATIVHVDDLARAIILALEAPRSVVAGEIFNIGSNEQNYQMIEIGEMVSAVVPTAELIVKELEVDKRNYYVCFDKARDTLGFHPIHTVLEGIREINGALACGVVADYRDRYHNNQQFLLNAPARVFHTLGTDWVHSWREAQKVWATLGVSMAAD